MKSALRSRMVALPLTLAGLAVGAVTAGAEVPRIAQVDEQALVVTRAKGSFEPTCSPQEVGERLRALTDALRPPDTDAMEQYWAWEGEFHVFGISFRHGNGGFRAFNREGALQRLIDRGGLRMRFRTVNITADDGNGWFDADYWTPNGNRKDIAGKFKVSCESAEAEVVSAFGEAGAEIASCPDPPPATPRTAMIICTPPGG